MPSDGVAPELAAEFRVYDPAVDPFGADGYPVAWHTLKHAVREQAGHRCIRCGHPYTKGMGRWSPCDEGCVGGHFPLRITPADGSEAHLFHTQFEADLSEPGKFWSIYTMAPGLIEALWRILTVHHLNGVKADCRWWNLASLCQRCHLVIQAKVHMQREYIRPHSDWFKPYAAAHYAFKYLGQDLTRPEVEARLDELLALELREEPLFT